MVIPPDIIDDKSAEGMVTHEGGEIKLKCVATGSPEPIVTWKREDGRNIILREDGQKQCKMFGFGFNNIVINRYDINY